MSRGREDDVFYPSAPYDFPDWCSRCNVRHGEDPCPLPPESRFDVFDVALKKSADDALKQAVEIETTTEEEDDG